MEKGVQLHLVVLVQQARQGLEVAGAAVDSHRDYAGPDPPLEVVKN